MENQSYCASMLLERKFSGIVTRRTKKLLSCPFSHRAEKIFVSTYIQRANFVAKLLRSTSLIPGCDDYTQHGWSSSGEPIWTTEVVPENIIDILRESTPDEEEPPNDDDQVNDADNDDDEDVEIVDYS